MTFPMTNIRYIRVTPLDESGHPLTDQQWVYIPDETDTIEFTFAEQPTPHPLPERSGRVRIPLFSQDASSS